MDQIRQKFTQLSGLKKKKKIHKFLHYLKYKHLRELQMYESQTSIIGYSSISGNFQKVTFQLNFCHNYLNIPCHKM